MPHFLSNGLKLHFEQHGSGTPLILLHGFGQHGGSWDPLVPSFARFFKVIVPDLRGCGRSEVLPRVEDYSLLRHAEALEKMGRDLRHFIEQSERPDLTHGALDNEPDQQDEPKADT